MKKVLVLAPHTDDGELGCGGTVARLLEEGCEVHFAVFSTCAESVPAGFPADELKTEFLSAMECRCDEYHSVFWTIHRRYSIGDHFADG